MNIVFDSKSDGYVILSSNQPSSSSLIRFDFAANKEHISLEFQDAPLKGKVFQFRWMFSTSETIITLIHECGLELEIVRCPIVIEVE